MHGGATPNTARISQEVLTGAAFDVLMWPAKTPAINIFTYEWSVMLRRVDGVNPLPKNATELHAACTVNDRTSHRRAHDGQWTALCTDFVTSSKLEVDIFITIE